MKDYILAKEYWAVIGLIQKQCEEWQRETGDYPRRLSFDHKLFDRLCAEMSEIRMRQDQNILSMIESFKFIFSGGEVIIERSR